jgi:predicted PurR-regulated permease PerM
MTESATSPLPSPRPAAVPLNRPFDRERLFVIFFFAAYFFLLLQLFRVLAPFLAPLLGAAMLSLVVFPVRNMIARSTGSTTAASAIVTMLVTVTVVIPIVLLVWALIREATTIVPAVNVWVTTQHGQGWPMTAEGQPFLDRIWNAAAQLFAMIELDIRSVALETARDLGNRAAAAGAAMVRQLLAVLFQLLVLLLALFFFLRDGPQMIAALLGLVPMEAKNKAMVLQGLDRTLVAMVRGTLITACAQGALVGVGLAMFGVPVPVLLGFAATFLAVVPFVGTAIIWVPASVYLALNDHTAAAVGLAFWGLIVVGLVDNLLRPIVVGSHARLPATLLFIVVVGGLQVYGLVGGLISPLLIACVFAFARIYRDQYLQPVSFGR